MNNHVIIMAGGIGSRFWPSSRSSRPKQFLDVLGVGKSLIQLTYERFRPICPPENFWIVTHENYKEQVKEHLPEIPVEQILCEPARKNTAPCVTYATFELLKKGGVKNCIVTPSDHVILKEQIFLGHIEKAIAFSEKEQALMTIGIQPTYPNTGYGYIKFKNNNNPNEIYPVEQFTEKPNLETAKTFLDSGEYLWNAGIYVWNINVIVKALQLYATTIYNRFEENKERLFADTTGEVIKEIYKDLPEISVDYAVMEQADNLYTLPADIGWSDLGTWASLHKELSEDDNLNTIASNSKDKVLAIDTKDCIIRNQEDKLVVVKGLKDYIIVDESDVLLIYPKNEEQEIRQINKMIKDKFDGRFS